MKLCVECSRCYDDNVLNCESDNEVLINAWPDSRLIGGKYRLESLIASGGMGAIYQAYQLALNREVAIKLLLPQLTSVERMVKQFHREALAIARLDHPNIVPIYDYGTLPGHRGAYLVMRLVHGHQLSTELADEGALSLERTFFIMQQICNGVAAAHAQQIIHCDLKPDNILIECPAHKEIVQIVDFGIAKLREWTGTGSAYSMITTSTLGTPQYMSPEQCCGEPITLHTDIYSLGIILFEMIIGKVPFNGVSATDIAKHHLRTPIPMPSRLRAGLPIELDDVIFRALHKEPDKRYQSVSEFFEELSHIAKAKGIWVPETLEVPEKLEKSEKPEKTLPISKIGSVHRTLSSFPRIKTQGSTADLAASKLNIKVSTDPYMESIPKEETPAACILLVDADGSIMSLFNSAFESVNSHIEAVTNSTDATSKLSEPHFDLVICEAVATDIDGLKLFNETQELSQPPLFILVSPQVETAARLEALEQGIEDYWSSSTEITESQIRLKRLLQRIIKEKAKKM